MAFPKISFNMFVGFVDLDLSWRSLYFTKYEQLNRHLKRQLKAQHIALQKFEAKKKKMQTLYWPTIQNNCNM